jgi:hypothetical protein
MQRAVRIFLLIVVCVGAACGQHLTRTESKLIGDWSMPRGDVSEDGVSDTTHGFDTTSLKSDHTFSQTAHPVEAPPAHVLSGTWRVSGNELVMKFTRAHPSMQEMVGQELRLVISDLQQDKFVSANAQNQSQKFTWTRVK